MLFLPRDDVFLCNSLYSYKYLCVVYGKIAQCFQYTFGVCVCNSSAKKTLKRHLLSLKIALLLILQETFYAVLPAYLNFNVGKLAFEGRSQDLQ